MKDFSYAVLIARLQPPHEAHIEIINKALEKADKLIIVLGSHGAARDVRNPWLTSERKEMVRLCFDEETNARIEFVTVRDHLYNDTNWMADVQQKVTSITGNANILLVGHDKDKTTKYLNFFPQWEVLDTGRSQSFAFLTATDIRNAFFNEGPIEEQEVWKRVWQHWVHPNVKTWMNEFRQTDSYARLHQSYLFLREYKEQWKSAPFPPTFVTTDAVVIASGHVLLVKRKFNPGADLFALPGGFLDNEMTLTQSMVRELKSETRIRLPVEQIQQSIKMSKVFDHPERSLRGRTITHAYLIRLPDGEPLPEVKGDTDAAGALWMQLGELHLHEDEFFEDHLQIIDTFLGIG